MCARMLRLIATSLCWALAPAATTPADTILDLEKKIERSEIAAFDPDVDADIKKVLVESLKKDLATLQGLLEKAIQQPELEKVAGKKALEVYNSDLKLALWERIELLTDDNTRQLLKQWKSIPGNESQHALSVADAKAALGRLKSVDDDSRVGGEYLAVKNNEAGPAQKTYDELICQERQVLMTLQVDTNLASDVVTKIKDRVHVLEQAVNSGKCKP